ncbi:DEAD/DEAH box helicase [Rhodocaloribacter sp.]
MITFQALGLSREIINGILDAGYTTPTPIQAQAIPVAAEGRDLIGCAQTGTGKTAAFVMPMLSRLQTAPRPNKGRPVRALVVTPTRELAQQVEAAVRVYGKHTRFRSLAIYGGVGMHPQLNGLRRGVDIVVATPGRLLDHLRRGSLDLSQLEILVLDEADRMLDMGFLPDIRRIVAATPEPRQTMLFSATMPGPIRSLAETIMDRPTLIEVGERRNPAETVTQQVCLVQPDRKMDLLFHLLQTESMDNVLIFSRTKHRADRIKRKLGQRGFSATVLHSNRSQSQRQRALSGFKNGQFQIMVATDIAARGIDVESISHVINYDTPNQAEDYIHRIGRTGRARTTGDAITFVAADERSYLRQIERHTGQRLTRKVYDGFEAENEDEPIRIASSRRNNPSYPRNGRRRSTRRR